MMTNYIPSPEEVGRYYDEISQFLLVTWAGNIHDGYWHDDNDNTSMLEAQEQMTDLMISKTPVKASERVLDIGCGFGKPALKLAKKIGCEVVGISIGQKEIDYAKQLAHHKKMGKQVTFKQANALDLPFEDNSFDAAWMFASIFHTHNHLHALKEAARVLKSGGYLVINEPIELCDIGDREKAFIHQIFQTDTFLTYNKYTALLPQAGFMVKEAVDISQHTKKSYRALTKIIQEKQVELSALDNQEHVTVITSILPIAIDLFRTNLGNILIVGSTLK